MKFLINTFTHWNEPPRARHQVAYALSAKYSVVFVAANKLGLPRLKTEKIHDNLTVFTPYFPIGNKIRYRLPVLNELYQRWLYPRIRRLYRDFQVINFDFTAVNLNQYFKDIIFYCNDSFVAISRNINPAFIANYHSRCFRKVASGSKFCIGVSEMLTDILKKYNEKSYVIPLGGPEISQYKIDVIASPSRNKMINVGLVGFIKPYSISYNLINLLVEDEKLMVTLVGPIEGNFMNFITRKDKVRLTGPKFGRDLYNEINKFDVAIAPYSETITKNDQIGVGIGSKSFQYLSLGKPVVISNMAGLRNISMPPGFIYIAAKEEDFASLIIQAHNENSTELIRQRVEFGKNNTWEKRSELLIDIYSKNGSINQ